MEPTHVTVEPGAGENSVGVPNGVTKPPQTSSPVLQATPATLETEKRPLQQKLAVPNSPLETDSHENGPYVDAVPPDHPSGDPQPGNAGSLKDEAARKRELLIAFAFVFVPMSVLAFTLIAFVYYETDRVHFNREGNGTPEMPAFPSPPANAYYTTLSVGGFLLVASWASTSTGVIVAPFMLLFSFVVARELTRRYEQGPSGTDQDSNLLKEMLTGSWTGVLHWVEHLARRLLGSESRSKNPFQGRRATHIAALGLCGAGVLSVLVIIGDNWLHLYTTRLSLRYFDSPTFPAQNGSSLSAADDFYAAGWTTIDNCSLQLTTTLPQNRSAAPLPCSLNITGGLLNVAYAPYTYETLDAGISQVVSGFNGINFTQQQKGEVDGSATNAQVITHVDSQTNLSHAMLFYIDASEEVNLDDGRSNYGVDYVANTTSMVTQCSFATQQCQLTPKNSSTDSVSAIPFNCSAIFNGDLNQTPLSGLERASGWYMSFYELVNGVPSLIPYQAQANPFSFYTAAAVDSISFYDLGLANSDGFIDAGQGRTAFALSCNATVYDVQFAMINGSIADFNATLSDPRKANIIQAPLQVGFGQYALFQAASAAAVATGIVGTADQILDSMTKSLSQVGMAGGSAAFTYDKNIQQRFRWDVAVTQVPFAPFWFLVVSCLLYSVCGLVIVAAAFMLRRDDNVKRRQSQLLPNPQFSNDWDRLKEILRHPWDFAQMTLTNLLCGFAKDKEDPEDDAADGLDILPEKGG